MLILLVDLVVIELDRAGVYLLLCVFRCGLDMDFFMGFLLVCFFFGILLGKKVRYIYLKF